jgi:hypothetical protein
LGNSNDFSPELRKKEMLQARAIPGKVRSGFPSGIAQNKELEQVGDSIKR